MPSGFLDQEARLGGAFLHPGGRIATDTLLAVLDPQPGQRIVEIGCGTGATAELVAARPGVRVVGLDRSAAMLAAARERLRATAHPGDITLVRADASFALPFADGTFDALYAESVIALLDVETTLAECARVLAPGAKLAFNERIWKPGVSQAEADTLNAQSRRAFGIPAATRTPLDRDGWLGLLRAAGFVNARATPVTALALPPAPTFRDRVRVFRYRTYLSHPREIANRLRYLRSAHHLPALDSRLESYLCFAESPRLPGS
jgi:SAM-dependent methyltransferase